MRRHCRRLPFTKRNGPTDTAGNVHSPNNFPSLSQTAGLTHALPTCGRNGMNIPVCNAGHAIVRESQSVKRDERKRAKAKPEQEPKESPSGALRPKLDSSQLGNQREPYLLPHPKKASQINKPGKENSCERSRHAGLSVSPRLPPFRLRDSRNPHCVSTDTACKERTQLTAAGWELGSQPDNHAW